MVETKLKRTSLSFTPDDVRVIRSLRTRLKEKHGKLSAVAIVRLALRQMQEKEQ